MLLEHPVFRLYHLVRWFLFISIYCFNRREENLSDLNVSLHDYTLRGII